MQLQGPWKSLKSPWILIPKYSGNPLFSKHRRHFDWLTLQNDQCQHDLLLRDWQVTLECSHLSLSLQAKHARNRSSECRRRADYIKCRCLVSGRYDNFSSSFLHRVSVINYVLISLARAVWLSGNHWSKSTLLVMKLFKSCDMLHGCSV